MAAVLQREFSFCDKAQNNQIITALYEQKQSSTFCDVIMKVCGREIYAHSNVLAAASPYFHSFLSQDLPRQFSQRSQQIIEIQIDGSEPNVWFEEAVTSVVDFIYTGKMHLTDANVSQICEIGRIMQMENVVKFCTTFQGVKDEWSENEEMDTTGVVFKKPKVDVSTMTDPFIPDQIENLLTKHPVNQSVRSRITCKMMADPVFHAKIKAKQLVSVACQIYPHLLPEMAKDNANLQDQATSTDNRYFETLKKLSQAANRAASRGRKRKMREDEEDEGVIETDSNGMILSTETGELLAQEHQMIEQATTTNDQIVEGVDETTVYHIVTEEVLPSEPQGYETTVFSLNQDSDRIENTLDLKSQEHSQEVEYRSNHDQSNVENLGQNINKNENLTESAAVSLQQYITSTPESDSSKSPRRSRRVSKPTPRLQQFHELQELHGNQLKRVRQEIINIIPDGMLQTDMVDIMHLDNVNVENSSEAVETVVEDSMDMKNVMHQAQEVKLERSEQEEAAVRLLSLAEHIVQKKESFEVMEEEDITEATADDIQDLDYVDRTRPRGEIVPRRSTRKNTGNMIQIGPGKYQCDTCAFSTNKVRQMSAHIKLHKLENNTCYYCEAQFDNKDMLADHMSQHKGPVPFFCHVCSMRFKSRTLLNMHLPKHSDDKPFICHVCSMGFKWKHALKCHMITHSNKKEHLCDICGYATAHKSQLKAHRKIHSGDTLKCHYPDCNFLATKSQNMKYHLLTHTKEKPHQCDMCGQNFSLVKNLRRHLLLHNTDTKQSCMHCTFSSTRVDKLKEHLLKMHSVGTPPERRLRVTDLVNHQLNPAALRMARAAVAAANQVEQVDQDEITEEEILEEAVEIVKVEAQLMEQVEESGGKDNAQQISQLRRALAAEVGGDDTTLIEIIQEDGQPMRILRNQSIMITPSGDNPDGTHILEQVSGEVQDYGDVVHIGTASSAGLVLTEPIETTITSIPQHGSSAVSHFTGNAALDVQVAEDGLMSSQVITAVPGGQMITTVPQGLEIHDMDGDHVTYAEMVEVQVDQVTGYVQQGDVQLE